MAGAKQQGISIGQAKRLVKYNDAPVNLRDFDAVAAALNDDPDFYTKVAYDITHNLVATTAPTVNDDADDGYSAPNSLWYDTVAGEYYRCMNATVGSAVWIQASLTPDDLATVAISGDITDTTGNLPYARVSGTPTLATIATSGLLKSAEDLSATAQAPGSGQDGYALVWDNGNSEYTLSNIGGDVTKVGTPVNNQVGVWTGDGTIEGDADFTFDGTNLYVDNGAVYARNANDFNSGYAILGSFSGSGLTFALQNSTATDQGVIYVQNITDSGTTPVLIFDTGSTVATRPLLAGYNNGTKHFEVDASGNWEFQNDLTVLGDVNLSSDKYVYFSDGVGSNRIGYDSASTYFEIVSRVHELALRGGVNDANKKSVEIYNGTTLNTTFETDGTVTFKGEATFGSGTSGSINVLISDETIIDNESRRFEAIATHNSNSRRAQIGIYTHSGITNSAGYIRLDAEDGQDLYYWNDNSNQVRVSTAASNIGTTGGTVIGTQTSDIRVKNIEKTGSTNRFDYGLETAVALGKLGIQFHYTYDKEKTRHLGFSAQGVQKLVPQAVYNTYDTKDGHDNILAMNTHELLPVAFKGIEQLNEKVEANTDRIAELERIVEECQEEIKLLKAA